MRKLYKILKGTEECSSEEQTYHTIFRAWLIGPFSNFDISRVGVVAIFTRYSNGRARARAA